MENSYWKFSNTAIELSEASFKNGYVLDSHPDINGKWGGDEAWCVHVTPDNKDDKASRGILLLYTLVGLYEEVGLWPEDEPPSKWSVVQMVTHALRDGVDPGLLEHFIKEAIFVDGENKK